MMDNDTTNNYESIDSPKNTASNNYSDVNSKEEDTFAAYKAPDNKSGYAPSTGYTPSNSSVYSMNGVGNSTYSGTAAGTQNTQYSQYSQYSKPSYNPSQEGGIHTTYVNGQGYNGASSSGYYQQSTPYSTHIVSEKQEKKAKNKTKGKVAALLVACMLLSLAFGAVGAFGYNYLFGKSSYLNSKGQAIISVASNTVKKDEKTTDGTIAGAAELAKNSVVEISTESVTTSAFFGQYVTSGAGSGVIIDAENGYIITCAHVVSGATSVTVRLTDGSSHEAKVVGSDTQTDIAVISIDTKDLKLTSAVIGDSDNIVVGETAIAIGNPLGTLGGTVSSGIVSALDREIKIGGQKFTLMQIDTSINPGNSGGGLFDIEGNLIGIVNAKSSTDGTSTTIEGLGFAIPINKAIEVATQLTEQGYVSGRVKLGIQYYEVTSATNAYSLYQKGYGDLMNYITDYGVYFIDYTAGQSGDLMFGDRVVAIDGTSVSSVTDISSLLEDYSVGDTVKVTVSRLNSDMRRSQMVDISVTLIEYVPENALAK